MIKGELTVSLVLFLRRTIFLTALACLFAGSLVILGQERANSIGFISHHDSHKLLGRWQGKSLNSDRHASFGKNTAKCHRKIRTADSLHRRLSAKTAKLLNSRTAKVLTVDNDNSSAAIKNLIGNLRTQVLVPGVVYKKGGGALRLNVLDVDTARAPVMIKPIVAQEGSSRLQTVNSYAATNRALAAINANYFKKDGVALGTLIIDGDWVAGPLYDRVALGISKSGFVRIDKVNLGGVLYTSNLEAPKIWVNNINQPHRTGCHVIAYTRRWGACASLPYDGCLVAIDAQGRVVGCAKQELTIPYGGMVLSDSKDSTLASLRVGDATYLQWRTMPDSWSDVVEAVSGGPMLIKDGNFCIDLQAEKFHQNWCSNNIKARTACGVTADNHLILVTLEGNHTIFDLAHIMHDLGAVDAMNLDGGGSTTMVIHNATVNMENKSNQRRVAAALGIFETNGGRQFAYDRPCRYIPRQQVLDIVGQKSGQSAIFSSADNEQTLVQEMLDTLFSHEPAITAENLPDHLVN